MDDYRMLTHANPEELAKMVTHHLRKGWTLQGGPLASAGAIIQAIARDARALTQVADRVSESAKQALYEKKQLPLPPATNADSLKRRILQASPDIFAGFEPEEITQIMSRTAERLLSDKSLR